MPAENPALRDSPPCPLASNGMQFRPSGVLMGVCPPPLVDLGIDQSGPPALTRDTSRHTSNFRPMVTMLLDGARRRRHSLRSQPRGHNEEYRQLSRCAQPWVVDRRFTAFAGAEEAAGLRRWSRHHPWRRAPR